MVQTTEHIAAMRCVMGLTGRKNESYGRSSIWGNPMDLGRPSAARLADCLRIVFLTRPCRRDEP